MRGALLASLLATLGAGVGAQLANEMVAMPMAKAPRVSWGGPLDGKGLEPCDDDCLCEPARKPKAPVAVGDSFHEIMLKWEPTSRTTMCDTAMQVQMQMEGYREGGASELGWKMVYNGPATEYLVDKLPIDQSFHFRVRERNCMGLGEFSEVLEVHTQSDNFLPDAPFIDNVTIQQRNMTSNATMLCVRWGNYGEDQVVLYFRLSVNETTGLPGEWETGFQGHGTVQCVDDLMSSTYYQFKIQIVDPLLENSFSKVLTTKTKMLKPLIPDAPVTTFATTSSVAIKWEMPEDPINKSPAAMYFVEAAVAGDPDSSDSGDFQTLSYYRVAQTESLVALLDGLHPGTPYAVRIISVNAAGESKPSAVHMTATNAAAPDAPTGVHFTAATADSVTLAWEQSSCNGSPLSYYEVAVSMDGDDANFLTETETFTHTRAHIVGMVPDTTYAFKVRAKNAIDEGAWSQKHNILMPQGGMFYDETNLTAAVDIGLAASAAATRASRMASLLQAQSKLNARLAEKATMPLKDKDELLQGQMHLQLRSVLTPPSHSQRYLRHTNPDAISDELPMADVMQNDPSTFDTLEVDPTPLRARGAVVGDQANMQVSVESEKDSSATLSTAAKLKLDLQEDTTNSDGSEKKNDDVESDDVSDKKDVTKTDPNQEAGANPPDVVSGKCDLREGCLQKDAELKMVVKCPNDCYSADGHGYCLPSEKCQCAMGWSGDDCNTASCTNVGDCSGHGKCISVDTCECSAPYNGKNCDMLWTASFKSTGKSTLKSIKSGREGQPKPVSKQAPIADKMEVSLLHTVESWDADKEAVPVVVDPLKPVRKEVRKAEVAKEDQQRIGTYITIPAVPAFEMVKTSDHTVMFWFKVQEPPKMQMSFLSKGDHFHGSGFGIGMMEGGYPYCGIGSDQLPYRASNLPMAVADKNFSDGSYHHLTCRITHVDGSRYPAKINLLIDGNEVQLRSIFPYTGGKITYYGELTFTDEIQYEMSEMSNPNAFAAPLIVGAGFDQKGELFNGFMSDLRIFRTGLLYDSIRTQMWTPMKLSEAAAMPDVVLYLPLTDCRANTLAAATNEAGTATIYRIPNTLTECMMTYHPLAGPSNL